MYNTQYAAVADQWSLLFELIMAARSDQDNVISRHSDNMADTIDKPTQAASELNVAVQPNLTPVTSTTRGKGIIVKTMNKWNRALWLL